MQCISCGLLPISFFCFPLQTHAVLRQAWSEGMKPCLVLNKVKFAIEIFPPPAFVPIDSSAAWLPSCLHISPSYPLCSWIG